MNEWQLIMKFHTQLVGPNTDAWKEHAFLMHARNGLNFWLPSKYCFDISRIRLDFCSLCIKLVISLYILWTTLTYITFSSRYPSGLRPCSLHSVSISWLRDSSYSKTAIQKRSTYFWWTFSAAGSVFSKYFHEYANYLNTSQIPKNLSCIIFSELLLH